jgi:AAA domain
MLHIATATKFRQFARVCLWGTSKAGKTHGALALAKALAGENGKVGVISSEYASSQLLQHRFPHDIVNLAEVDENSNLVPGAFSPARYEEAIRLFTNAHYEVIVIDSLSHVWEGEGGLLEQVASTPQGKSNFDDGWGRATPLYKHLINTILAARCHMIITLRGKDAYIHEDYIKGNGQPGKRPKNVGQCPVMRKGFGYEMHLTLRMDNMVACVEATGMQDYIPNGEEIFDLGGDLAQRLLDALDGVPLPEPTEQQKAMRLLLDAFYALSPATYARIANWEQMALRKALDIPVGTALPTDYTDEQVEQMRTYVMAKRQERANKAS